MKRLLSLCLLLSSIVHAGPSVIDDEGQRISLATPARRIVSLSPHATENLFAAGLGERIVGVDESSNFPAATRGIARVGRFGALDLERIAALKPDLVVGWGSGNNTGQLTQLRRIGLTLFISEPRRLPEIASNLRRLAILGGVPEQGDVAARRFEEGLEALRREYAAQKPVSVFYQIWDQPLMTVNGSHSISDVLRLCGGRNVFADLSNIAPTVNIEAVLRADPQMILGSGSDDTRPQWLDDWRRWPQLRAVKANALVDVPPDLMQRSTLRMLDGARRVCAAIDDVRNRLPSP